MVLPLSTPFPLWIQLRALFEVFQAFWNKKLEINGKILGIFHLCICPYFSVWAPSRCGYWSPSLMDVIPGCLVSLIFCVWRGTTGAHNAKLRSFSRGTGIHWGVSLWPPQAPGSSLRFLLTRAALSNSFHPATGSEQSSAGKKEPRPGFPPCSLSTTTARGVNFLIAKGAAWKLYVTELGQEFFQPQENMESFDYKEKGQKFSSDFFP